jgi:ADP-heptose:LPS heptosyltransferase
MLLGDHGAPGADTPALRRVAVLRALQLGDLLCAVPALRSLRAALPDAEIVLVGLPWCREFVARYGAYVDGFREFPGYPGLPERAPQVQRIPSFLAVMQAERFDLAVQLHGSGPFVNELTVLFGARRCAGFYLPGGFCPDPDTFLPWPDEGLEVRRLLKLMRHLGAPDLGEELVFPVRDSDRRALWGLAGELGHTDYVCVHPGASVPERRWPAEHFAVVADALGRRGYRTVLTGVASEAPLARSVAARLSRPPFDLTGKTDPGTLAALLEGARLLVCNDTGVAHLSAAVKTPAVILSTGDNPARWAPADDRRYRVLCDPRGVRPAEVLAEAWSLLSHAPAAAARVTGGPGGETFVGAEPCGRSAS